MGLLGKIAGSISPAFGMVSGKGAFGNKDVLGSLSPLFGMLSGHGLGGAMGGALGGMGGMGGLGLLMQLMGHGGEEEDETAKLGLQGPGSDSGMYRPPDMQSRMPDPMKQFGGSFVNGPYQNYLTRFGG